MFTFLSPMVRYLRLPLVPILGGLPISLTTIIGKPIYFNPEVTTPEALSQRTKAAMEDLIRRNQRIPGSVLAALWERWTPLSCRQGTEQYNKFKRTLYKECIV